MKKGWKIVLTIVLKIVRVLLNKGKSNKDL